MLALVSTKKWYRSLSVDTPMLLISGKEDPIGDFGKGIMDVHHRMLEMGCLAEAHLYDGVRHELQSDPHHEEIFLDVLHWMKNHMEEPQTADIIY